MTEIWVLLPWSSDLWWYDGLIFWWLYCCNSLCFGIMFLGFYLSIDVIIDEVLGPSRYILCCKIYVIHEAWDFSCYVIIDTIEEGSSTKKYCDIGYVMWVGFRYWYWAFLVHTLNCIHGLCPTGVFHLSEFPVVRFGHWWTKQMNWNFFCYPRVSGDLLLPFWVIQKFWRFWRDFLF